MDRLFIRVASGVFVLWATIAVVVVLVTFAVTAHREPREAEVLASPTTTASPAAATSTAEPSRPSAVPDDADLLTADAVLGAVSPVAGDEPHIFYWLTCDDQLLTISTTQETVYAAVECARYWLVHEVVRPYQGKLVRISIGVGPSAVLVMEAATAGAGAV